MIKLKRKDSNGIVLRKGESQLSDGRYRYRYDDDLGKQHDVYAWKLRPSDKTPEGKEGEESLREKEDAVNKGLTDGLAIWKATASLNDIITEYISKGKEHWANSTYNVYNTKFEKYIKNQIGRKKVSKVTPDNILDFYNSLYNAEKDALNIETIKVIDRLIKPSLQMAVDKGIIRSNPARGAIGRLKHKRSVLSNEADSSDEKARALEDEQLERLLEYVGDRYCYLYYYPLFYLLAWTGCRINEMLALTWYDVDFDEEIIHIRRSLSYQKVDGKRCFTLEKPKTKAGIREIPMLANVKKILSDLKEQNDDFKTPVSHNERVSLDDLSPFVFTNRYGNLIHYGSVDRKLHEIIDRYNLQHEDPLPQISCHGFRHTFTCWLCENAEKSTPMETIKYIQSILGHADASVTMNIYAECRRKKRNENHEMLKQKAAL